jgi:pyridoxal phosphate enzyme (YggS family)
MGSRPAGSFSAKPRIAVRGETRKCIGVFTLGQGGQRCCRAASGTIGRMTNIDESQADRIRQNLGRVREQMAAAVKRAGREPGEVKLVGVTKYVEPAVARLLVEAGLNDLAESRPQELWTKAAVLSDLKVTWHMIGHLQRNKVRRTLPLVACIHSADSLRLLAEISHEAVAQNLAANVLLEVNVSGDAAKHGLAPDELGPLLPKIAELPRLKVLGLMTMAALEGGPDEARRNFAALRELRDTLVANCPSNVSLKELSMGMSSDFEIAIEEGATIVRVGSALFEGIG